ncbi:MAG: lipoyl synthase [Dysgonamonadaceae bacterium]|nr:lipoyl synthase [Dysgonamonadaceae bacterium]
MEKKLRKPEWLRINLGNNDNFSTTGKIIKGRSLHTICESGKCPNRGECWNRKTATLMIAGDICTRSCKFCNTKSGKPLPLDLDEPAKIAESIRLLGLKHAVITSVDRDDLPDYGSLHWANTISEVKKVNPEVTLEVLIPDFRGDKECIQKVIDTSPDIISHNIETVERLTPFVRSVAKYSISLAVLKQVASSGIAAKSGLMIGLGETKDEVVATMKELFSAGCTLLSIGQYLQPAKKNIPVMEYFPPETFSEYKHIALNIGFNHVESGPLVRSSYHSIDYL